MLGLEGAACSTPPGTATSSACLGVLFSHCFSIFPDLAIMSTAYLKNAPPGKMYSEGAYAALATPQLPPAWTQPGSQGRGTPESEILGSGMFSKASSSSSVGLHEVTLPRQAC